MKYHLPIATALLLGGLAEVARADVIHDELFPGPYARLTQNIAGGNMAVYQGRSGTTVGGPPTLTFTGTSTSAQMYWAYFTDPGANVPHVVNGHVVLGVGEVLTASVRLSLQTMPADTSTYAVRFGLFDDSGSRQAADLTGGGSSAAFNPNPGYAVFFPLTSQAALNNQFSIRQHTTFNNNIFNANADFTTIGSSVGGAYTPLASATDYIFRFSVFRDVSSTVLTATLLDGTGTTTLSGGSVTQTTGTQLTSFDWLGWRTPQAVAGGTVAFTEMKFEVTTAPEPSVLGLVGLGLLGVLFRKRQSSR